MSMQAHRVLAHAGRCQIGITRNQRLNYFHVVNHRSLRTVTFTHGSPTNSPHMDEQTLRGFTQ
jgi:hypothetical protein